jgi:predicted DCC family thiol-disulfide oxidoreductase YuxK
MAGDPSSTAVLVYDGDCPFCSRYVRLVRLRESLGGLKLVNARDGGPLVDEVRASGHDLDQGMVLLMDGQTYHGDACMHRLALMSSPSGTFNRLNRLVFSSPTASRLLYPVLRAGRNATLRLLGRRRLDA